MVLVGHHSAPKVFSLQKQLVKALNECGQKSLLQFVPVNVTNAGSEPVEYTQRTRSFLFAALAVVVARMFGKDEITFYENGVVSLNLPIAADVVGARATRTTHPRTLRGFERIFSSLLDQEITVRTPFQWLTKSEVVRRIEAHGAAHLLGLTNSCTRPREMTKAHPHCGVCSQCIDRRFAVLAAGMAEADPAERYRVDLLTGDRTHDRDVRMAAAYVKYHRGFAEIQPDHFLPRCPEITSALAHFGDTPREQAAARIFEMYMRHHEDVARVLESGAQAYARELSRGTLPGGSVLAMLFNRHRLEVLEPADCSHQVQAFMERLAPATCEFAVDASARKIEFQGDLVLEGKNFDLFEALLPAFRTGKTQRADIAFVSAPELARRLGLEDASLRQQVRRLREAVSEHLAVQLGLPFDEQDVIENRSGEGYRINPQLREMMPGNL
jgi:7-cyano-7-deazaguanine synthase in queuosine biosynthesis